MTGLLLSSVLSFSSSVSVTHFRPPLLSGFQHHRLLASFTETHTPPRIQINQGWLVWLVRPTGCLKLRRIWFDYIYLWHILQGNDSNNPIIFHIPGTEWRNYVDKPASRFSVPHSHTCTQQYEGDISEHALSIFVDSQLTAVPAAPKSQPTLIGVIFFIIICVWHPSWRQRWR